MVFGSGHQVKNKNRKRQDFEKKPKKNNNKKPMDSFKNINSGEFPPNKINRYIFPALNSRFDGAQRLSGRVLDSRRKGRGFEPNRLHCVVSLSKTH